MKKCPICQHDIIEMSCPVCQLDQDILERVYVSSRQLYNKALERANDRDLSTAIQLLHRALNFDKQFTEARNLLGLIEYRLGNLGEAIDQWQISFGFDSNEKENPAYGYIKTLFAANNKRKLEQLKATLEMYNDALIHLNQKSEDLAIIKLRKAIHINSSFVRANNLLAFCYLSIKQEKKARNCINNVLNVDCRNPIAVHYKEMLQSADEEEEIQPNYSGSRAVKSFEKSPLVQKKPSSAVSLGQVGFLVVGLLLGVLAYRFLLAPEQISKLQDEMAGMNAAFEVQKTEKEEEIVKLNGENEVLLQEVSRLENRKDQLKDLEQEIKITNGLLSAAKLYVDEKPSETTALLLNIDTSLLSDEGKVLYQSLKEKTFLPEAEKAYREGEKLYKNQAFKEAIAAYERSLALVKDADFSEYCYYRIPRSYKELGMKDEAITYFDEYFKHYKEGSLFYGYAKGHYEQLTAQ